MAEPISHEELKRRLTEADAAPGEARHREAALRWSEARCRSLLQGLGQGYCELELVRDGNGRAVDQRYVELNPAFERLFGIPAADATGRTASEVFPGLEPWWTEAFDGIARRGEPERIEHRVAALGRTFEVFVHPDGGDRLTILYEDVTERRRAEDALRGSEARQAFLLKLGDALRAGSSTNGLIEAAAHLLGEHLGASRIVFAEFDEARGVADIFHGWFADGAEPFPAVMRLEDHEGPILDDLRQGRTVRVEDTRDPALARPDLAAVAELGVAALLSAPLVVAGRLVVNLSVHQHEVRHWTDAEVALVEEVAERLWADLVRARAEVALRISEDRLARALEAGELGAWELDLATLEAWRSPEHDRIFGYAALLPEWPYALFLEHVMPEDRAWVDGAFQAAIAGRGRWEFECRIQRADGEARWIWAQGRVEPDTDGRPRRMKGMVRDVSDRRTAEARLAESEERFRSFAEASSDTLWIIDAETGRLEYLSPAFEPMWGESRERIMADLGRWAELVHPDDRERAKAGLPLLLAGEVLTQEYRIVRPCDGAVRWIRDTGFPIRDEAGRVRRVAGTAQDVTLAREAEALLAESEARFRQFGAASSDVLWIRDADTLHYEYVSPSFEAIYGQPVESVLDGYLVKRWAELIVPEDRESALDALRRVRGGERVTHEFRIRRADGEVRWIRDTDFPLLGEHGRVQRLGGIGQDVTELRRIEAALRDSEARLRMLMEGIPQLVWRSCDRGQWTWASPQWCAFTGQSQDGSHGRGWLEVVHPDDRAATLAAWEAARPHGMLDAEYRLRRASDGAYLWHHTRSLPLRDEGGRIVEWLGTSTDVQQLKELQERQAVMVAELQHRTRNLIAVVRSISAQTMAETGPGEAFQAAFSDRMAALSRVQGLLSRSESEPITIGQLVRLELDALGAGEVAGRIVLDGPEVPLRNSVVQTLALAVHELATNARKYGALATEQGRLAVTWRVREADGAGRRLGLEWVEEGLDRAREETSPASSGYGRELIERALPYALGARTSYELGEAGVRCTIDLPLGRREPRRPR